MSIIRKTCVGVYVLWVILKYIRIRRRTRKSLEHESNQSWQKTDGIGLTDHWFSINYKYRGDGNEDERSRITCRLVQQTYRQDPLNVSAVHAFKYSNSRLDIIRPVLSENKTASMDSSSNIDDSTVDEEDEDDPFAMAVKELSETNRLADEIARVSHISSHASCQCSEESLSAAFCTIRTCHSSDNST